MRAEDRIDSIFKRALKAVRPPAPVELDWTSMARAAKDGGARTVGGGIGTRASFRWKIIGAVAVVIVLSNAVLRNTKSGSHTMSTARSNMDDRRKEGNTNADHVKPDDRTYEMHVVRDPAEEAAHARAMRGSMQDQRSSDPARAQMTTGMGLDHELAELIARQRKMENAPLQEHTIMTDGSAKTARSIKNPPLVESVTDALVAGDRSIEKPSITDRDGINPDHLDHLDPQRSSLSKAPSNPGSAVGDAHKSPPFPRFSISPWVSLDHSIFIDERTGSDVPSTQLSAMNGIMGSVGVRAEYALTRNFAVLTGVQYASKGALHGTIHSSSTLYTEYDLSGTYLEVPVSVKYILPKEGKDLYLRVGAQFQLNMRPGSDMVAVHDVVKKEVSTVVLSSNSTGLALDIGAGVKFRLSKGIGLFIEPSYQYAFSPMVKHPSFDQLPFNPQVHTFSLCTGITFQFHSR